MRSGWIRQRAGAVAPLTCLLLALILLSRTTQAPAQSATPDRATIARHLDAVFGSDDRVIRKWPDGVHYLILGRPSPEHREGVHRVMSAIAEATGVAIDEATGSG